MLNPTPRVLPGIDVLFESHLHLVEGARIGLVAVPAAVDAQLVNVIDRLYAAPSVQLHALFGPEHGVRGDAQAGQHVEDSQDDVTGLPVYSLYGSQRKPQAHMLEGLDVLVVDLFDAGCRYWTFLYTMAYCLEAAAEHDKRVVVLDRPNPITGTRIEGNVLDSEFASFVGMYPIPIRTGMTLGEAALLFNRHFGIGADLHVVPCAGWQRDMWYDQTGLSFVPPSPNTPTLDTLTLYPGTCLIEGTTLSEGRGTTRPFEMIGAPWVNAYRLAAAMNERNLPGIRCRPVFFVPTFSKHQGQLCQGVQLHLADRDQVDAVAVGVHLLHALKEQNPAAFAWRPPYREGGRSFIDLLAGTDQLRHALDAGSDPDSILKEWEVTRQSFLHTREEFLLYDSPTDGRRLG